MILSPTLTLSAGSGGAITRPTFSRDFAGEKSLNHGVGPAIAFTRNSVATYFDADGVLRTATSNVPRFDHDPATRASRGLLIEEARTNLFQRSAEFDNAYWTKAYGTIEANTLEAPDGTITGDTFLGTYTDGYIIRSMSGLTSGQTVTFSCFLRVASGSLATNLRITNSVFTTIGNASISVTATWQRFSVSVTVPADGQIQCIIGGGDTIVNGTRVHLWGAQLEQGAFPTSYIPTTTAAAPRSADIAVVSPISSFYSQAEGALFAEATLRGVTSGAFPRVVQFDEATASTNRFGILCTSTPTVSARYLTATVGQFNSADTITIGTAFRVIVAVTTNNGRAAVNGALVGSDDTLLTMNSANTNMSIGSENEASLFNGHISKIAYYPKRLSNALLQQLTT
jgi:hypothetical protein